MAHSPPTEELVQNLKGLRGNFTLTPTYVDLIVDMCNVISWYYAGPMWKHYTFPHAYINEITRHFYLSFDQVSYVFYIAIVITLIRYLFENFLCKPFSNWLELKSTNRMKFPESAWKCFFYLCTWSYNIYLLNYCYNYFHEPYLIWDDWAENMTIPFDIQLMYLIQCGFYLHSIYGTLYMDYKRKDYYAMLLHHILTLGLISVSFATRYHKVGLLVLFMHDITDIWLELAKGLHYFSSRKGGRLYPKWELASNVCFIIFLGCWFLFRLYWYPLKVLYSTGVVTAYRAYEKGCGLYGFFNSLLWILLGLNVYWLFFILQFLCRVLANSPDGAQDPREDEDDEFTPPSPSANVGSDGKKKN